jgi:uncharacterized membrane protein
VIKTNWGDQLANSPTKSVSTMATSIASVQPGKAQQITLRVLTVLLFVWMLTIGVFKLIGTEPALVDTFTKMNMLGIMPIAGVFEILGGIGLLLPRFRTYAALGLLTMFIGAFAAHWASLTLLPMGPMSLLAAGMALCVIKLDGKVIIG